MQNFYQIVKISGRVESCQNLIFARFLLIFSYKWKRLTGNIVFNCLKFKMSNEKIDLKFLVLDNYSSGDAMNVWFGRFNNDLNQVDYPESLTFIYQSRFSPNLSQIQSHRCKERHRSPERNTGRIAIPWTNDDRPNVKTVVANVKRATAGWDPARLSGSERRTSRPRRVQLWTTLRLRVGGGSPGPARLRVPIDFTGPNLAYSDLLYITHSFVSRNYDHMKTLLCQIRGAVII